MKEPQVGPDGLCTCESCQQSKLIVRLTNQMIADRKTIDALKAGIKRLRSAVEIK